MSFSIINNSLKNNTYFNKNINKCSYNLNKLNNFQYTNFNKVVLINNSKRNLHLNTSNLLFSSQNSVKSSLSKFKQQQTFNSISNDNKNYLFSQEFINRKFYSTFDEFEKDEKDEKDQKVDFNEATKTPFDKVENSFDKEKVSSSVNNKFTDSFTSNNNDDEIKNNNKKEESEKKKEIDYEAQKEEVRELYNKIRDSIVDKLNKIPSTLDKASTFKFDRENLEKLSSASPYLLWTSFILASSMSACLFRQLTGSSIISHAVMIGIDFPAIVNVSHLYNQGGKMIAKELGAEQCPSTSELCGIVEEVAKQIKLENVPDVYIHQSEEINALTAGIKDDNSVILITKGLLNNLKPEEIK